MPSSTFFRLPPEKQEKLLRAAQSEFARVPFADASINRIIQAADISRGSFYMYFRDKEELFTYLLDACAHTLEQLALDSLEQYGGDPFAALLDLFDRVQAYGRLPERDPAFEGMMRMFQLNYPMNPALILRSGAPGSPLPRLASQIDRGLFDLRHPDDLGDCLHLLCAVTGSSILTGLQSGDPAPARTRLVRVFDILQRGMSSKESRP